VRLSFALPALLGFAAASFAEGEAKPSTGLMKEQLHAVVRGQLEAFRKKDLAAAYQFAASEIRAQFSQEEFGKMVRTGYAAIAENQEAVIGLTLDDGEAAVVNVRVVGPDKKSVSYQYLLQREEDAWRIGGVVALRDEGTTI